MPIAILIAATAYCLFYFYVCNLPVVGIPTFRIDYYVTSLTQFHNLDSVLLHSRPVSGMFAFAQRLVAQALLHGQTPYIIYPLQHIALLAYFFCIARVIESLFELRFGLVALLVAWAIFMIDPGVMEGAYKLETIVGTLSMLFGGFALIFLSRWAADGRGKSAALFILFYTLSVFSKEDFALAPLVLLGWYLIRDGQVRQRLIEARWVILAVAVTAAFYFVYLKMIITDRALVNPVKQADSPYYMALAPLSLLKVIYYYSFGINRVNALLTSLFLVMATMAFVAREKWRETTLVTVLILGLIAPYAILPNHMFAYYSLKWVAWQSLTAVALVQVLARRKYLSTAIALMIGGVVIVPIAIGISQHKDILWFQANYLRSKFDDSRAIRATLLRNRIALNRAPQVAIMGIGPGEVDQTPWQANGELEFYLRGDLGVAPAWIVLVKTSNAAYLLDDRSAIGTKPVVVLPIDARKHLGKLPSLQFDAAGHGTLMPLDQSLNLPARMTSNAATYRTWSMDPAAVFQSEPRSIASCPKTGRQTVRVNWDVAKIVGSGSVEIWVARGDSRKLWLAGRAAGTAVSGPWVDGGMQFQLEDARTHRRLATVTVGGPSCS